ncbi:DUF1190 domain-containing protein [Halomonas huangheensis]|uniref:DUF1190 domain-containing protein n=1 Tax=Halomonas huangheensis TaxID=1178482 RepID=W1NCE4_9GAMM|nr:DUF1190 domain-containing protein [Halomonas huangheensis]ALM52848.1 hypothetical protein AR456_11575 [Halomonas huangheensis]ERL53237.1 hypothetical protein BJB45_18355 [Halomonas huangheensis]
MKRTASINLERMRKAPVEPRRLTLVAAIAVAVSGCSDSREATVYNDVNDCIDANPELAEQCQTAYESALSEAATSGPRYDSQLACESDFGQDSCRTYQPQDSNGSWFVPAMAGFLFARALDGNRYQSSALYTSRYMRSPVYGKWSTVDGRVFGNGRQGRVSVDNDLFKPKPAVSRTMSRGGFGSVVAAKSNFGGSSSSSRSRSWGG